MATNWTTCKRLILKHLREGVTTRFVGEGEHGIVNARPAVLLADVDGGVAEFSVKGAAHYEKTLFIKVLATDDAELETTMRAIRRCWEKDGASGQARIQELCRAGVLNIYPASSGEKSLPDATAKLGPHEGLLTMTCHYRETA